MRREVQTDQLIDWQKQRGRHTNKEREDKTKRVKQRDKGREMN